MQGRVDMMQKDFQVLIEQKAGKRDEYHRRHKEDHFIQMMLYQGVLMYNFGQETANMQTFLLYSKYADGLLIEHFAENLFRESIKLRNYIVHNEMQLGDGAIGEIVDSLSTDLLNELQIGGKLWNDYQEPQLQTAINTLKRCTPLERAYFNRFLRSYQRNRFSARPEEATMRLTDCRQLAYSAARETGGGQYPDRTDHPRETKQRPRQRIRPH